MVVQYPLPSGNEETVWAGSLSEDAVKRLLDSPARREIVKRLGAGETAVWLLLESGDKGKDDAAAKLLEARLAKLKTLLKLPELTESPEDLIASEGPPLRIAFSVVRLSRNDPGEQMLVSMLLHSEEDLADLKDEPMAFPVFGRGRALWALVGKGINEDTIDEAGAFLVGPCSCQVKRLNPGTDLLVQADWDALVEGKRVVKEPEIPPLRGLDDFVRAAAGSQPEPLPVPPRELALATPPDFPSFNDPDPPPSTPAEFLPYPPQPLDGPTPSVPAFTLPTNPEPKPETAPAGDSRLVLLRNIGLAVLVALGAVTAYILIARGKNTRAA
jgi:hypothetical protein